MLVSLISPEQAAQRAVSLDAACAAIDAGMALFQRHQAEAHELARHPAIDAAMAAYQASPGPVGVYADLSNPAKARAKRAELLMLMRRSAALAKLRGRPHWRSREQLARIAWLRATEKRLLAQRPAHSFNGFAVTVSA